MEININEVIFKKELYPRFELDNQAVNKYRFAINKLPPITISKNKILVDGYHRLVAYKLENKKEISAEILDIEKDIDILVEAIKRNSTHGKQLSLEEKKQNARQLWTVFNENGTKITQEAISGILSVSQQATSNWLKDLVAEEDEKKDREILELYLNCWTQEEIAEKFGLIQSTITRRLEAIMQNTINGKMHIPDDLQYYNVWKTFSLGEGQLKFGGQTPCDIIENLVYYYSPEPKIKPRLSFGKVVDPMAGSGVIRDVCLRFCRQYLLYDISPLREDIPIEKADILKPLPDKARGADLVYFDPPYYNLMKKNYPKNAFTNSYDSFLDAVDKSLKNIYEILKVGGKLAFIMKPMNEEMLSGNWFDSTVDTIIIAKKQGYKIVKRISAPLSTQQFNKNDLVKAKEKKVMLNILRDIVVFEKDG